MDYGGEGDVPYHNTGTGVVFMSGFCRSFLAITYRLIIYTLPYTQKYGVCISSIK